MPAPRKRPLIAATVAAVGLVSSVAVATGWTKHVVSNAYGQATTSTTAPYANPAGLSGFKLHFKNSDHKIRSVAVTRDSRSVTTTFADEHRVLEVADELDLVAHGGLHRDHAAGVDAQLPARGEVDGEDGAARVDAREAIARELLQDEALAAEQPPRRAVFPIGMIPWRCVGSEMILPDRDDPP